MPCEIACSFQCTSAIAPGSLQEDRLLLLQEVQPLGVSPWQVAPSMPCTKRLLPPWQRFRYGTEPQGLCYRQAARETRSARAGTSRQLAQSERRQSNLAMPRESGSGRTCRLRPALWIARARSPTRPSHGSQRMLSRAPERPRPAAQPRTEPRSQTSPCEWPSRQ